MLQFRGPSWNMLRLVTLASRQAVENRLLAEQENRATSELVPERADKRTEHGCCCSFATEL